MQSAFTSFDRKVNNICVTLTKLLKVKVETKELITVFYLMFITQKCQHCIDEVT